MLVVVNQPHINDFKIEGSISPITLDNLKNMFGNYLKVEEEDDEWVNFRDTDWFKEIEASRTPSVNLKFYRTQKHMTQTELGTVLGVKKQYISDMEHDRKEISKSMAKKLSKIFNVPVSRFI